MRLVKVLLTTKQKDFWVTDGISQSNINIQVFISYSESQNFKATFFFFCNFVAFILNILLQLILHMSVRAPRKNNLRSDSTKKIHK